MGIWGRDPGATRGFAFAPDQTRLDQSTHMGTSPKNDTMAQDHDHDHDHIA